MTTTGAHEAALVVAVREALAGAGDPERAAGQQAYMKSAIPYRGLTSPQLRALLRPVLADPALAPRTRSEWEGAVRALWDDPAYREERYAALAVTGHGTRAAGLALEHTREFPSDTELLTRLAPPDVAVTGAAVDPPLTLEATTP